MGWLSPTALLLALIAALALFGAGYAAGHKVASNACAAREAALHAAAQAEADALAARRAQAGQARETARERIRIVYRNLREQAHDQTTAVDCGLDADGLRLWNAANAGAADAVSGQPDYALSTAPAAIEWLGGGHAAQPHRGDGALRAMPRSAGAAGGVQP